MSEVATIQPASSPPSSVVEVEGTPLRDLVHHREQVRCDTPMEDVHRFFSERHIDFVAMIRDGRVCGVCGRAQLAFQLGSRFGFALNARSPAHLAGVKHPLIFAEHTPLREVLEASLSRRDDEFYEDVALVDAHEILIGLIPVEALVRLQSLLVNAQLEEMRRQNVELFAAGHALRQAQALSAGLFSSDAVAVGLLAPAGRLQAMNRRLSELFSCPAGQPDNFLLEDLLVETERAAWRELLETVQRIEHRQRARDFELDVPGRGRRIMHFSAGWIAETSQICLCVEDVTQQREIERRLQLEEKQKLLDTLAGGVAHELNNKLTPVLGYAELLAHGSTPEQAEYVGFIRRGVQESSKIIRQLLRLAKPEGGSHEIVDLRDVIREAASMLQFEVREARAQLRVESGTLPLMVAGDPAQLKQVIMNLGLNALHAMADMSDAVLRLTAGADAAGVFLEVSDNGTGIAPAIVGRIFDPFFTTKGPKGTGLGLSICESIVRQHGGEIRVWSQLQLGTRFTIRLPVHTAGAQRAAGSGRTHQRLGAWAGRGRPRVLVVDDEQVIRNFLKEAMRHLYDCAVDEAADGVEALARVKQAPYDLILSDIRMPEMTGPEFYGRLQETHPEQAAKVVFVTGHMGEGQLPEDQTFRGVPMLVKPFTLDRLASVCAARFGAPG